MPQTNGRDLHIRHSNSGRKKKKRLSMEAQVAALTRLKTAQYVYRTVTWLHITMAVNCLGNHTGIPELKIKFDEMLCSRLEISGRTTTGQAVTVGLPGCLLPGHFFRRVSSTENVLGTTTPHHITSRWSSGPPNFKHLSGSQPFRVITSHPEL